jgi:hypothetical protein
VMTSGGVHSAAARRISSVNAVVSSRSSACTLPESRRSHRTPSATVTSTTGRYYVEFGIRIAELGVSSEFGTRSAELVRNAGTWSVLNHGVFER